MRDNRKVADLSHPISSGMQVYPGDPEVLISSALSLQNHGANVSEMRIGSHTATHLDAPAHMFAGGRTVDQISLDELQGEALIIRVRDAEAGQALNADKLRLEDYDRVPRIVVIDTGWAQFFGDPKYLDHPYLTKPAAEKLCDLGMHLLAVDTPSPDQTLSPAQTSRPDRGHIQNGGSFGVHEAVLGTDRQIIENLRGLEGLPDRVQMAFYPLPLVGTDGAPVRAIAYL